MPRPSFDPVARTAEFNAALSDFLDRLKDDPYVLAAVLVGSLDEETTWRRESLGLWIIEADGVAKRLKSDGQDERIFRTFAEAGINIHAEIISRSRFRRMIEGNSRTAFNCSFFARRELVYCEDESISNWFDKANSVATTDQSRELLAVITWTIHARKFARKLMDRKNDLPLARQELIWAAHAVAHAEVVRSGQIHEHEAIYRALELQPDLFQTIYLDVISGRGTKKALYAALEAVETYLTDNADEFLKPLLKYLKKQRRVVPLSELSEHFAHTQLYPWHLESACEWLEQQGRLEKVSAPFRITKKSRVDVEEPAYFLD